MMAEQSGKRVEECLKPWLRRPLFRGDWGAGWWRGVANGTEADRTRRLGVMPRYTTAFVLLGEPARRHN